MSIYLWIKSLHIIAVISWMAGMLYLPRLFVYHADQPVGGQSSEMLKIMELKLLRYIMNPAMSVVWLTGLFLAWQGSFLTQPWFLSKFALVIVLSGTHGFLSREQRAFAQDRRDKSAHFYRIINEVPTVFMICIVMLVVLKPF